MTVRRSRLTQRTACASVLAMPHVAVAPMLAHDAPRRRRQELLSKVCVGHARLSSGRIATAMAVRLVTIQSTTILENARHLNKPCWRGSAGHAQLLLVVARSARSAKELAKTGRQMVCASNARTNVEGLASVMGEGHAQNTTASSRRKELVLIVHYWAKPVMNVKRGAVAKTLGKMQTAENKRQVPFQILWGSNHKLQNIPPKRWESILFAVSKRSLLKMGVGADVLN